MTHAKLNPRSVDSVPLLDLKSQYLPLKAEIEVAIREVCDSQHFIMGPQVTRLEERVAEYSGAAFGIGVSSVTDALLVARAESWLRTRHPTRSPSGSTHLAAVPARRWRRPAPRESSALHA
jgi:hypothetical protein